MSRFHEPRLEKPELSPKPGWFLESPIFYHFSGPGAPWEVLRVYQDYRPGTKALFRPLFYEGERIPVPAAFSRSGVRAFRGRLPLPAKGAPA
jgi:hypothetical protein